MPPPAELEARFAAYLGLLARWNPRINLVGPATLAEARQRHVEDSLQLLDHRPDPGPLWLDLGSGGGLPGLIVACALADRPTEVRLIESDQRKATFLRHAARQLGLDRVTVTATRIEALPGAAASTVSARALAPLPRLMAYVARHLAPAGVALLPKGGRWAEELEEAQREWSFEHVAHPSRTAQGAVILEISAIHAH